jgi:hypothetical protein
MEDRNRGGFEKLGESLGEAAGRMAGRATDAAMSVAGSIFGAAVDVLGDWWGTDEARRAAGSFGPEQEQGARAHFEASAGGPGRSYDESRTLYQFGHVAAHNPDYAGRSFRDVEPQLERAWREDQTGRFGAWTEVRGPIGHGYEQRAASLHETREAGMRAQGGGTSAEADIRRSSRDPLA